MFDLSTPTLVAVVVGVVTLLALLSGLFGKRRPKNAPPNAQLGIPLIGNYIGFASNPVKFVDDCMRKYGFIYTVPMLHKNLTFLMGPEVSAPFFKLKDEFMSQPEVYGFMTPVFGKNVVYDAEPKKRVEQMQKMATGLTSGRLRAYVPKIEKETKGEWISTSISISISRLRNLCVLVILFHLHF